MESNKTLRKLALAGGVLYLLTFVASLPTLGMKSAVVDHRDFILGYGHTSGVIWACFLDFVCAIAGIGTAVALWPVTKRYSKTAALGFVTTRVVEAGLLVVGAISLMAIVTLRHDLAGTADRASLVTTGQALLAVHKWAFLFGPAFMAAMNALMLGTVLYRSRLVPRWMPTLGLVGAPILIASSVAVMFGWHEQVSTSAMLLTLPIATWEFSIGVYLTFKGFKTTPVAEPVPTAFIPVAA